MVVVVVVGTLAEPAINQAQSNVQNVQCVSRGGIDDSCFNYNSQNLANKGNVALAQDGGNGREQQTVTVTMVVVVVAATQPSLRNQAQSNVQNVQVFLEKMQ